MISAQLLDAATYYVATNGNDSNNGSSSAPFRTIQQAANRVSPGDTVIIRNGTYTGGSNAIAELNRSGSSSQWITFKAENEWGAILDGRNNSTTHGIILAPGLGYVRFEGLQIQGTTSGGFSASENTHDIVYSRNLLHDIGRNCTATSGGQVGFRDKTTSSRFVYDGNVLHTIGRFHPNEGCSNTGGNHVNHDHGMYLRGSNITIINNVFYNMRSGWSIQSAESADNWVISNNTFAFPNPNREGQIILWEGNDNIVVANNIFYEPNVAAIALTPCSQKRNTVVRNNITTSANIIWADETGRPTCSNVQLSNNRTSTNPQLVNPSQNNFRLNSSSPAINTADASTSPNHDHVGAPRPQGSGPDIGAFEFGGAGPANDTISPLISIAAPSPGSSVSGTVTILASASDNVGVLGVQFQANGSNVGGEDTTNDYSVVWNTANVPNGLVVISATARDAAGNLGTTALTVNVNNQTAPPPTPAPTLSINANPSSIQQGQGSTLNWTTTNASSCSASGSWGGNKPVNGSQGVQPSSNATYTLTCTGAGGNITRSASVNVSQAPSNDPPPNNPPNNPPSDPDGPPEIQLSSSASTVQPGSNVMISWNTTNATSCYAWGSWRGSRPVRGNESMRITSSSRFTLGCSGPRGGSSRTVMVGVSNNAPPTPSDPTPPSTPPPPPPAPTLNLIASPTSIQQGQNTTLQWASTNATSCSASGSWGGGKSTSGSQTMQPSSNSSYTLTCSGAGGNVTRTVGVAVTQNTPPPPPPAPAPSLSINASRSSILQGQSTVISWNSTNATSCSASGSWGGNRSTSGSQTMQPSSNATYRMTCSGPGGSITRTASVSVSANSTPSSPPPPTSGGALSVSLSASDTRIRSGQSVTISWSSKNATACIGAGHWSGSKPLSGSQVVRPTQTSYYVLGCSGTSGGISRVVQVIVD